MRGQTSLETCICALAGAIMCGGALALLLMMIAHFWLAHTAFRFAQCLAESKPVKICHTEGLTYSQRFLPLHEVRFKPQRTDSGIDVIGRASFFNAHLEVRRHLQKADFQRSASRAK